MHHRTDLSPLARSVAGRRLLVVPLLLVVLSLPLLAAVLVLLPAAPRSLPRLLVRPPRLECSSRTETPQLYPKRRCPSPPP